MPKSLVCGLTQSEGQTDPARIWIPWGIGFTPASQLCDITLSGNLTDYYSLTELRDALYIIADSGLPTSIVNSLWVPYRRNGSGNDFLNIYSGQLFNVSLWKSNQPGTNRDCVACDESGCHSDDCQV